MFLQFIQVHHGCIFDRSGMENNAVDVHGDTFADALFVTTCIAIKPFKKKVHWKSHLFSSLSCCVGLQDFFSSCDAMFSLVDAI